MPTSLFGLIPVVLMGMAIKIQEDRLRHQSDYRANTARCRRLVDRVFVDARWTDVQAGVVVSALQCWPEVSSTGGMPTSLFGLIPVVLMGMAIKIQEDRLRHQSDYRANT